MEYTKLTDEHKAAIDESTVLQIEQQHYAETQAMIRAEAINDEASILQIQDRLRSLETQHEALTK